MRHFLDVHFYYVVMYFDYIYYVLMMFWRMQTRKWYPRIIFPNNMGWRELLIVGVQYKQWDPGIVFSPIDFNFFGKQAVWEMDSPLNKVILIILQQKSWWFLSKIFMESQRLKVGQQSGNFKESYKRSFFNTYVWNCLRTRNIGKGGFFMYQIFHWITMA